MQQANEVGIEFIGAPLPEGPFLWIQIRERMHDDTKTSQSYISEILNIPENIRVEAIVAIGYPDESPKPRPRLPLEEIVYYEEFGRGRVK